MISRRTTLLNILVGTGEQGGYCSNRKRAPPARVLSGTKIFDSFHYRREHDRSLFLSPNFGLQRGMLAPVCTQSRLIGLFPMEQSTQARIKGPRTPSMRC